VSTYSSWGPTYEVHVKPQVTAPGGMILSTYPLDLGGHAVLSGTSMVCPYVAGSIALLLQARGKLDPATITNLLSANAKANVFQDGKTAFPFFAPVAQQGGGLIIVYNAAHTQTILSVSGISFNNTEHLVKSTNFSVKNTGSKAVTYHITHLPGPTVYTLPADGSTTPSTFETGDTPEMIIQAAALKFSSNTTTVPAG